MTDPARGDRSSDDADDSKISDSIADFVGAIGDANARAVVECLDALEAEDPPLPSIGDRIGRYRIVERLGEGGMGIVFKAAQEEPIRRAIALKLARGPTAAPSALARFRREQQVLAELEHPNIARMYDADVDASGRPFFAMELVNGVSITAYCDRERLDLRSRIRLFTEVCLAVQHAHQKGVLHRDLKPSNILVTTQDVKGVPKVIDFGLALLNAAGDDGVSAAAPSLPAGPVGTLEYMSPEQWFEGDHGVDTRSDVFALGVVLHQLLTGKLPWGQDDAKSTISERLRARRNFVPALPSETVARCVDEAAAEARGTTPRGLARRLRGELDAIVLRALAGHRDERYSSINGLASDLEAFLDHRPVAAAPPGFAGALGKLMRRHRTASIAAVLVALAILGALVVSAHFLVKLTHAREQLLEKAKEARDVRAYLEQVISSPNRNEYEHADPSIGDVLRREVRGLERLFPDAPVAEASLRKLFGSVFQKIGDHAAALEQFEKSLALLDAAPTGAGESAFPGLDSGVDEAVELRGDCVEGAAAVLIELGRAAEAETMLERALAAATLPSIPIEVRWNCKLGLARERLGKIAIAEESYRRGLEIALAHAGSNPADDLKFLRPFEDLMRFLLHQKRPQEALELARRFDRGFANLPLRRSVSVLVLRGLAELRTGNLEAAEVDLDQALKTVSPSLPDHHPRTREILEALVEFHSTRDAPGDADRATALTHRLDSARR